MAKPRVTATDRLANVIDVVELSRRTGLLSVERGSGAMLEEGEVYFVSGRAIYAMLAGLRGREALAMLARWGDCRFSFDTTAPRPAPNVSGGLGARPNNPPSGSLAPLPPDPFGAPPSQAYPPYQGAPRPANRPIAAPATPQQMTPYGRPQQGAPTPDRIGAYPPPTQRPQNPADRWGLPPGAPYIPGASGAPGGPESGPLSPLGPSSQGPARVPNGAYGGTGRSPGNAGGVNGSDSRGRMSPEALTPQGTFSGRMGASAATSSPPPMPGAAANDLERRPRRAPDLRDLMAVVSSHHLTRSHRAILLLANGEHTMTELARLSSKPVEEVAALLQELEQHGLVYYY